MTTVSSSTTFASTSFSHFPLELTPMSPPPPLSPTLPDFPLSSLKESTPLSDSPKIPFPSEIETPKEFYPIPLNQRTVAAFHPTQSTAYTTTAKTMEISAPSYGYPSFPPMYPPSPLIPFARSMPDFLLSSTSRSTSAPHTPFNPKDLFQVLPSQGASFYPAPSVYTTAEKTIDISRSQLSPSYVVEEPIQQTTKRLKISNEFHMETGRIQTEISLCKMNIKKLDDKIQALTLNYKREFQLLTEKMKNQQHELDTIPLAISGISSQRSQQLPYCSTALTTQICTSSTTSTFSNPIPLPILPSSSYPAPSTSMNSKSMSSILSTQMTWDVTFPKPFELEELTPDNESQITTGEMRWKNLYENDFQNKWGILAYSYVMGYDWETINDKYFKFESSKKVKGGCKALFIAISDLSRDDAYLKEKFVIPGIFLPYLRAFAADQKLKNINKPFLLRNIASIQKRLIALKQNYDEKIQNIEMKKTAERKKFLKLLDDLTNSHQTTKRKIDEVSKGLVLSHEKEDEQLKETTPIQEASCSSLEKSLSSKSIPPFEWTLEIPEEISDQLPLEVQKKQGKKNWESRKWQIIAWSLFNGYSRDEMNIKYFKRFRQKVVVSILRTCERLFTAIKKRNASGGKLKGFQISYNVLPYLEKFAYDPLPH